MELEHSFTVPVPRERAWEVLLDVARVAPCMPGASLDSVDGDVIHGRIKVKVGPIAMTYAGTAHITERDAEAGVVTLEASGKETRGSGTASASVRSVLEDQGEQTHVTVHTNLNVTGKPAQFGRGVMSEVSGKLIGIFAANLAEMLGEAPAAATADQPEAATADQPAAAASQPTAAAADQPATAAAGQPEAASGSHRQSDLSLPLEELHLPLRSYNSLRREGVHTVGELAARTPQDLLAIENIGRASVEEIRQKLAERGLALGESPATGNGAQASPDAAGAAATGAVAAAVTAVPPATAVPAVTPGPAPAAGASPPAPARAPRRPDDEAINLLSVAGMPVLKRVIPVLAGLVAAVLVALGIRLRRQRERG